MTDPPFFVSKVHMAAAWLIIWWLVRGIAEFPVRLMRQLMHYNLSLAATRRQSCIPFVRPENPA